MGFHSSLVSRVFAVDLYSGCFLYDCFPVRVRVYRLRMYRSSHLGDRRILSDRTARTVRVRLFRSAVVLLDLFARRWVVQRMTYLPRSIDRSFVRLFVFGI